MGTPEVEARWRQLAEEVITGMTEWRGQHPRATLTEIETALDERLTQVRARMLEDVALNSAAANVASQEETERPQCAACGTSLEARGQEVRELRTVGNQRLRLRRTRAVCPTCGVGLFPPR